MFAVGFSGPGQTLFQHHILYPEKSVLIGSISELNLNFHFSETTLAGMKNF